jgi:hypothetical protein
MASVIGYTVLEPSICTKPDGVGALLAGAPVEDVEGSGLLPQPVSRTPAASRASAGIRVGFGHFMGISAGQQGQVPGIV